MSKEAENTSSALKVSPIGLRKHALNCINSDTPFMVWGNPGIGKSEILRALCLKLGYHFEDIRLSQIESIDLRGLPFKDTNTLTENGEILDTAVSWAVPDFLKRARDLRKKTGQKTAYFFDEINSGSPATMAAAYQFINDRRIGPHLLGEGDIVFAAGNMDTDGGITNSMPTPLCNRFRHYILRVDIESFLSFASESNYHPWVIGYLSIASNAPHLQMFNPDEIMGGEEKAYPTPRSWSMLSKGLKTANFGSRYKEDFKASDSPFSDILDEDLSMKINDLSDIASSCIGSGVAIQFSAYVKEGMDLPKAADILAGKAFEKDLSIKDSPSKQYFISTDCCFHLKEYKDKLETLDKSSKEAEVLNKEYMKAMENYTLFAKKYFGAEMFVFGIISTMIKRFRLVPQPGVISQDVMDLILSEFKKAKTSK